MREIDPGGGRRRGGRRTWISLFLLSTLSQLVSAQTRETVRLSIAGQ